MQTLMASVHNENTEGKKQIWCFRRLWVKDIHHQEKTKTPKSATSMEASVTPLSLFQCYVLVLLQSFAICVRNGTGLYVATKKVALTYVSHELRATGVSGSRPEY